MLKAAGSGNQQLHLLGVVEASVIALQRLLERRQLYRQRVAIARVKGRKRMRGGQRRTNSGVAQGFPIPPTRQEFGLQYLALAKLRRWVEQWPSKHIEQALQRFVKGRRRNLKEEIGVALAGRCIQLPRTALHEWHQALRRPVGIAA